MTAYHWVPGKGIPASILRKNLTVEHFGDKYFYGLPDPTRNLLGLPLYFGGRKPPPLRLTGTRLREGAPVHLPRDHQHQPILELGEHPFELVKMDPGAGKTFTSCYAAWLLGEATLVVVHSEVLADQWADSICKNFNLAPDRIGKIKGPLKKWRWEGRWITVAMLQTLSTHLWNLPAGFTEHFGTAIFDEVHHMQGQWFAQGVACSTKRRWGLSATPFGDSPLDDGIKWNFGAHVYAEASTKPYAVPLTIEAHWLDPSSWYDESTHGYGVETRALMLKSRRRRALAVQLTKRFSDEGHVVLTQHPHVSPLTEMHDEFIRETGLSSETGILHGRIPRSLRTEMADRPILFGLQHQQVTREGFDRPETSAMVVAGQCTGKRDFHQTIGRAGRTHPGKESAVVAFICDYTGRALEQMEARFREAEKKGATVIWEASRTA